MFIGLRLLEGSELAVEHRRRHEVAVAGRKPPRDEVPVAFQKDDADVTAPTGENIAVGALERRAGDDAVIAGVTGCVDPGGDAVEPGPAVVICRCECANRLLFGQPRSR